MTTPAASFPDSFLIGNGSLGAIVPGRPGVEEIGLNLDTVWSGGPRRRAPAQRVETAHRLREAIAAGDVAAADAEARALQSDDWTESYQPLGSLRWEWSRPDPDLSYRRTLDMDHASVRVVHGEATLDAWVSQPDDVIVLHQQGGVASGELGFAAVHPGTDVARDDVGGVRWLRASGRAPRIALPNYVDAVDAVVYGDEPAAAGATAPAGMGWAVVAAEAPVPGGGRLLIVAAAGGFRGWQSDPSIDVDALSARASDCVGRALGRGLEELRARHLAEYSELFTRVEIDLSASPDPRARRAQTYFDLGRYLLISSSRPGTQAANLQGIWNPDIRPGWSSNYTTNINVQMNYWASELVGLPEAAEPLTDLARELGDAGRVTAAAVYGAGGSTCHHNSDLWRYTEPVQGEPTWSNWATGLAWLCAQVCDRLDFDPPAKFAEDVALPLLRDSAEFLLDMLAATADGQLMVSPSSSPEHAYTRNGQRGAVTAGATVDQELAAQILGRYVDLTRRLGTAEPLAQRCSDALMDLYLPGVDAEGRLEEWPSGHEPTELDHRHLSHLYGVFPGDRITASKEPALLAAAHTALRSRLDHGGGYTGWSQAWVLALAARTFDRDIAQQALDRLTGDLASASLLDMHPHAHWPGGALFQIDGNLGAVAGIVELLLQSHDEALSLLPTLPRSWSDGRARGLRARGGVLLDIAWCGGSLAQAAITPSRDGAVTIEADDDFRPHVTASGGAVVTPTVGPPSRAGRWRWSWPARGGEIYRVESTG
ncbi:glycoside hydrolase family 95 protein [Arthrobacter sp. CJ23]|uniref:glycoside hydrolase family 95 protein n=1 Tax=Arthrobacter sp. CJ23 TaxID=2972479 RepID=UPI00215CE78C|nr:glycoside hydrolase family 95 protein [Arthrobacter sp. CJ23]UVJ41303.1 glycoside hydrolase family 95 protein [Arthrobacter sp. CJ23]